MSEMTKRHPLLILTPDQALRRELQGIFADFDVVSGETSEQILALVRRVEPEVVLFDLGPVQKVPEG